MALPKLSTAAILLHIAGSGDDQNFANAICKATGYPTGTVVPALARFSDRDGLLNKREAPTTTGRPRIVYALTDAGRREVAELRSLMVPRINALAASGVPGVEPKFKLNTSTIWLMSAAAMNRGAIIGYSDDLRPLTHQAAYAELTRLEPFEVFERRNQQHALTEFGHAIGAGIAGRWMPLISEES